MAKAVPAKAGHTEKHKDYLYVWTLETVEHLEKNQQKDFWSRVETLSKIWSVLKSLLIGPFIPLFYFTRFLARPKMVKDRYFRQGTPKLCSEQKGFRVDVAAVELEKSKASCGVKRQKQHLKQESQVAKLPVDAEDAGRTYLHQIQLQTFWSATAGHNFGCSEEPLHESEG